MIDLEAQPAAGSQRAVAGLEERRVVLGADRLEHLDRDDRVVGALDVAVVAQLDVDPVGQPGGPDPLASPGACCAGEIVIVVTRQPSSPAA